jgi:CubicO group peptidase (beta-lactamase class C family)
MTKNQRPGAVTPRGESAGPWGLGISLGIAPRFGAESASRSFGHGGSQSSIALCDPDNDVVIAMVFNGRPGAKHARRTAAVGMAIYQDLGIVSPDAGMEGESPQE